MVGGGAPQRESAPGAIVLAADYRGLGVVRSLGRRGIRVWVLSRPGDRLAGCSRYAERSLRRPPAELVPFLLGLRDVDGWTLFPTSDEDAALVGRHHAALSERFVVTSPPWDVMRWGYDKRLMHELADELGIAAPRTVFGEEGDVGFP